MKCELDHSIFPGSGISALAVTPGGQILVGCIFGGTDGGFYLEEFNANGSVNTSFGTAGEASLPVLGAMGDGDLLVPMAIEPDGQIVVGGDGYTSGGGSSFYVGRFNASGSVDTNFGSAGVVTVSGFSNGLSMNLMSSGKLVVVGQASSSSLMLQQFNTLTTSQTYYAEYDANYNITSLTNSSGTVVERYAYSAYGIVTVLNAGGTVRGDGTGVSSFATSDYLYQGMRYSGSTGTYASETRVYSPSLGRWLAEDPLHYINGADEYQYEKSNSIIGLDPSGMADGGRFQDDKNWRSDQDIRTIMSEGSAVINNDGFVSGLGLLPEPYLDEWRKSHARPNSGTALEKQAIQNAAQHDAANAKWRDTAREQCHKNATFTRNGIVFVAVVSVIVGAAQLTGAADDAAAPQGGGSVGAEAEGGAATVATTLSNFNQKVGQATDGVLGGYVNADGTVDFVPFTRAGFNGHADALTAGAIPKTAIGGFSVAIDCGKIVGYNFNSVLNGEAVELSTALQQQIKAALGTVTALPK